MNSSAQYTCEKASRSREAPGYKAAGRAACLGLGCQMTGVLRKGLTLRDRSTIDALSVRAGIRISRLIVQAHCASSSILGLRFAQDQLDCLLCLAGGADNHTLVVA